MGLQWVSWGRIDPCNGLVSVHVGVVVIDVLRSESDLVMMFGVVLERAANTVEAGWLHDWMLSCVCASVYVV